jgi:hypothetical protein
MRRLGRRVYFIFLVSPDEPLHLNGQHLRCGLLSCEFSLVPSLERRASHAYIQQSQASQNAFQTQASHQYQLSLEHQCRN